MRNQNLLTGDIINRIKAQEAMQLRENWRSHLRDFRLPGRITRLAIRLHLDEWLDRNHGSITYRMTQILTGHGCFNTFLCRIQKWDTEMCFHCGLDIDSSEHTLQWCPSWHLEREDLKAVIGASLSLKDIIKAIVRSDVAWSAFRSFAECVLTKKEEAERTRALEARALVPLDQRVDRDDDSD